MQQIFTILSRNLKPDEMPANQHPRKKLGRSGVKCTAERKVLRDGIQRVILRLNGQGGFPETEMNREISFDENKFWISVVLDGAGLAHFGLFWT